MIDGVVSIISVKPNKLKLCIADETLFKKIRSKFAWPDPARRHNKAYRMGFTDGFNYCITPTGQFNTGLLKVIVQQLNNYGYNVSMDTTTKVCFKAGVNRKCVVDPNILPNKDITLRDYQINAVKEMSQHLRCIVRLPTASGKSAVITSFILHCMRDMEIWQHFIILVPTKSLVVQFRDDMINDYGIDPSLIGVRYSEEKTWNNSQKIFITTRDTLYANKDICEYLKNTYCIMINDECHTTKSDMVSQIISRSDPAAVMGLTGTMPENDYDFYSVVGNNGPLVYEEKTVDLQESGYLPGCHVTLAKVTIPKPGKVDWNEEKAYIRNHPIWQSSIVETVRHRISQRKNCLLLVYNKDTGDILKNKLARSGIEATFFSGTNSKAKARQEFKEVMENNTGIPLIATYGVFSTGISIKNLHTVMFLEHAPGACTLIQAIGRGLRNHVSKEGRDVEILDIYASVKYSMKHRLVRKKRYDVEHFEHHEATLMIDGSVIPA